MSQSDELQRKIKNHEKRIVALEKLLIVKKPVVSQDGKKTLPGHIFDLRSKKFFATPKTAEDVHKKLQSTYSCEKDRISMALLRLANKKQLRKASKARGKTKAKAYIW